MSQPRVLITMEGGLIQFVYADQPVTVLVSDHDAMQDSCCPPDGAVTEYGIDGTDVDAAIADEEQAFTKEMEWRRANC